MSGKAWSCRLLAALPCLWLAACGGGGSSGDDAASRIGEQTALTDIPAQINNATPVPPDLTIDPSSYQLVSSQRVGRTAFEYTYQVNVANSGGAALNVHATVTSLAATTLVTDGEVAFGDVAAASTVAGNDTFTIRQDRTVGFDPGVLQWAITFDAPDGTFELVVESTDASTFAGSGTLILFRVERAGGFSEVITVTLGEAPTGIGANTVVIPEGLSEGELLVKVDELVAAGTASLEIVATANGMTRSRAATLNIEAPQPRAQEKIRQALSDGIIDHPTSLLYRGYARYGDPRLPVEYRGSGSAEEDTGLEAEIERLLPEFSPESRALLEPLIRRPTDPASLYAQVAGETESASAAASPTMLSAQVETADPFASTCTTASTGPNRWISRRSSNHPFRVWAECDPRSLPAAATKIQEVINTFNLIWAPMTADLSEPPPDRPDYATPDPTDQIGDAAIDIYIVMPGYLLRRQSENTYGTLKAAAWATQWDVGLGTKKSGYIIVPDSSRAALEFQSIAIHEFFHLLQFGQIDVNRLDIVPAGFGGEFLWRWWFMEASATWAEAHYDRTITQLPQRLADLAVYHRYERFQKRGPETPLNVPDSGGVNTANSPAYAAFIWPYFMEQEKNASAAIVTEVWKKLGASPVSNGEDADKVLDGVFPFAGNFREFAVRNFNQQLEPGDPLPAEKRHLHLDRAKFQSVDGYGPRYTQEGLNSLTDKRIEVKVAGLAAQYFHLPVDEAGNVRQVVIDLREVRDAGLDVDAFVKIADKDWERRDLNPERRVTFCFDDPEQALQEIWVIVSDHTLRNLAGQATESGIPVKASDKPCEVKWKALVNGNQIIPSPYGDTRVTTTADVVLAFDDVNSFAGEFMYTVESGTFNYSAEYASSERDPPCSSTGSGSGALKPFDPADPGGENSSIGGISIYTNADDTRVYAVLQGMVLSTTVTTTGNCNDSNEEQTTTLPGQSVTWWFAESAEFPLPPETTQTTNSAESPDGSSSFNWTLTRILAPEPIP